METKTKMRYNGKTIGKIFPNSYGAVLEFLITRQDKDYSINEIKKGTKVSSRQIIRVLSKFTEANIVEKTRTVGVRTNMYQLKDNVQTKDLKQFHLEMLKN